MWHIVNPPLECHVLFEWQFKVFLNQQRPLWSNFDEFTNLFCINVVFDYNQQMYIDFV